MVKQTVLNPYHGILLIDKKEGIIATCDNLAESPENYNVWKMPIPNGHFLYDSIYIISWNDKVQEEVLPHTL